MELLDQYADIRKQINEYFVYTGPAFSILDCRKYFWAVDQQRDIVIIDESDPIIDLHQSQRMDHYDLHYAIDIPAVIFRTIDYTMIVLEDDFIIHQAIFDNRKEQRLTNE